jgi:exosortase/archaeosortase family protein
MRPIIALLFLLLAMPASAQDWMVQYLRAGEVKDAAPVYPNGSYEFVRASDSIPVYLRRADIWDFIGMYGAPYGGYPQASLPGTFPTIAFPRGSDFAIVTPVVATPELAILRRLVPKHLYGQQLAALANPALQRVTAWGAATMLHAVRFPAVQRGVFVDLPTVRLEVAEWCSGLVSMKWLLLVATMLLFVGSARWPWKLVLIVVAPLIALEVNMLRVASVGAGIELFGHASRGAIKEWTAWGATALGVAQVVGLGLVMKRRVH